MPHPAAPAHKKVARPGWLVLAASAYLHGALILWILCLPWIDPEAMTRYGLVSVLPASYFLAGFFLAVAFVLSQSRALTGTALPVLTLVMLVVILHATPAIVYETMRYPWAWRHIGVIDLLQRNDAVAPGDSNLLIYLDWPLFFLAFSEAAKLFHLQLSSIAEFGRAFPFLINLLFIPLLLGIFRHFTDDTRLAIRAVAIFLVGNWIGQDYFSPQAVAFVLYLAILVLCLRYFARRRPGDDALAHLPFVTAARKLLDDGRTFGAAKSRPARIMAGLLFGFLVVCLVGMHQLTPVLLLLALGGLFAIGRLAPWPLAFALVAETVWLAVFADTTMSQISMDLTADFGRISTGTFGAMIDIQHVSKEQRVISLASRGLSGTIGLLAIVGFFKRRRAGARDGMPAVLATAPLVLVPLTSYGGEIVFRAYFFSLPFLAFFAAAVFAPARAAGREIGPVGAFSLLAVLLAGGLSFLLANNGKDRQYLIGRDEVAAVEWLQIHGAPGALLIEGNINYPRQLRYPEKFVHLPLYRELPGIADDLRDDPAGLLSEWLAGWPGGGYILITRAQVASDEALRLMPGGGLAELSDRLLASGAFCVLRDEPAARIFTLCQPPSANRHR